MTVKPTGRIDTTTAPAFAKLLENLAGETELVIDLAEVNYMSSAGLRCLLLAHTAMAKQGGAMKLVNVQKTVRDVLGFTGFDQLFAIS